MRLLLVSHYALPHLGGIEVAVDGVARRLAARGHEVSHVTSAARRPDDPIVSVDTPYEIVRVPAANLLEARLGVPYPLFSPRLLAALGPRVAAADVVHVHGYLYLSSVAALALAGRAPRRPVRVLTEHVAQVPYDRRPLDAAQAAAAGTVGRWTARHADGLVALNAKVDAELARLAPSRPRRIVGNGVDTERYRPAEPAERAALRAGLGWDDGPRVLFVGRLVAKKGLDVAVEAARRQPRLRLVVAGPGTPPSGLPANVQVLGALPPEQVAELYRAADVFLLPSRGEGFPVTAQEAMASGLPVLLGRDEAYGALLDGVGPGAREIEPTPEAALAVLDPLLEDANLRRRAGSAARAHAERRFGWKAVVDEHLALYDRLRPSPPGSADPRRDPGPRAGYSAAPARRGDRSA